MENNIILASASPRRKELLRLIFESFDIIPSKVDETPPKGISAEELPEYLAAKKASDIAKEYPEHTVIGADTCILSEGKALGKPKNPSEAFEMLRQLSGNTHKVITGCAVAKNGKCKSFSCETEVTFYSLSDIEIEEYIASGEPFDKAGGYGIQSLGALLVKEIRGDYFNVVGLPVSRLKRFLNNPCNNSVSV